VRGRLFRYALAWRYTVHLRKPLLLLRLLKNAFLVYVCRRPLLRYVDMSLDFACNLHCSHCFNEAFTRDDGTRQLTNANYRSLAAQCRRLGAISFSFQGGEPFLFPDKLAEVIPCFSPRSSLISVSTNGTLCTAENLHRLHKLGVDILTISIDSGLPEEHDAFRNAPGSFAKAMRSIDLALAEGFRVTIGTTVSHQNVNSAGLKKIMDYACTKHCLLVLILAVPAGRWEANDDILLTEKDLEMIDVYCRDTPFVQTDLEGNYLHRGCGAMKEILYLTPYGDVLACPFLHISFGKTPEEAIATIRTRALQNNYLNIYWPRCLAAADDQFREHIMSQLEGKKRLPVAAEDIRWQGTSQI